MEEQWKTQKDEIHTLGSNHIYVIKSSLGLDSEAKMLVSQVSNQYRSYSKLFIILNIMLL